MYIDAIQLQEAARMAMLDPVLLKMMSDWNNSRDYGEQDMLLCSVMNYVKEKKASGFVFEDEETVLINVEDYENSDCTNDCNNCECDQPEVE